MSDGGEGSGTHGAGALPAIAVFDIDGVLADVRHRLHFLAGPRRDWSGFFAAAADDPPIIEGIATVHESVAAGERVVYLTGRPERLRSLTEGWLLAHGLPLEPAAVTMRPDHDRRPARVFKLQALHELAQQATITAVWDDDREVVDAVRAAGWSAVWVEWIGPRGSELTIAQDRLGRS